MTRRRSLVVVAVAAVGTLAIAAGIAQGSSGSDGDALVATIDAAVEVADVRPCPGAAPVGQLDAGATVALTGRSADGAWLQLESPTDGDGRVWIDAALVVVTTTPDELPIARCGDVDLAIELIGGAELVLTPKSTSTVPAPTTTTGGGGVETTTSAAGDPDPGETTSSTTAVGGTPSTRPTQPRSTTPTTTPRRPTTTRPNPTTTRPPTTTTTTAPPDVSPPAIERYEPSVGSIFESGRAGCQAPTQVQLSARITDASGLSNVRLIWRVTNAGRTATYLGANVAMHNVGGNTWQATVGPVGQVLPTGVQGVLEWRIQAYDGAPARNSIIGDAPTGEWPTVVNC